MIIYGGQILRCMAIHIQFVQIAAEFYQKVDALYVPSGRGQMQCRIAKVIAFIWIATRISKKIKNIKKSENYAIHGLVVILIPSSNQQSQCLQMTLVSSP